SSATTCSLAISGRLTRHSQRSSGWLSTFPGMGIFGLWMQRHGQTTRNSLRLKNGSSTARRKCLVILELCPRPHEGRDHPRLLPSGPPSVCRRAYTAIKLLPVRRTTSSAGSVLTRQHSESPTLMCRLRPVVARFAGSLSEIPLFATSRRDHPRPRRIPVRGYTPLQDMRRGFLQGYRAIFFGRRRCPW